MDMYSLFTPGAAIKRNDDFNGNGYAHKAGATMSRGDAKNFFGQNKQQRAKNNKKSGGNREKVVN